MEQPGQPGFLPRAKGRAKARRQFCRSQQVLRHRLLPKAILADVCQILWTHSKFPLLINDIKQKDKKIAIMY